MQTNPMHESEESGTWVEMPERDASNASNALGAGEGETKVTGVDPPLRRSDTVYSNAGKLEDHELNVEEDESVAVYYVWANMKTYCFDAYHMFHTAWSSRDASFVALSTSSLYLSATAFASLISLFPNLSLAIRNYFASLFFF